MLFAQQGPFGGPPPPGGGPPPEFWIAFVAIMAVFVIAAIVIQVFFLLTLSRALRQCHPDNRTMEPGQVWLNLIPCFNIVWIFITVIKLADSLRNEYEDRRLRGDGDYGRTLGITYNVLNLLGAIPYLGALFGIAGLVCFILYWIKIAGYSRTLREDAAGEYDGNDEDDRGGRRRRADDGLDGRRDDDPEFDFRDRGDR